MELSGNTAPFAHWNGALPPETQFQASYATQLDALDACCSTTPCWSPGRLPGVPPAAGLPSIFMPVKNGHIVSPIPEPAVMGLVPIQPIGPGSLSSA